MTLSAARQGAGCRRVTACKEAVAGSGEDLRGDAQDDQNIKVHGLNFDI